MFPFILVLILGFVTGSIAQTCSKCGQCIVGFVFPSIFINEYVEKNPLYAQMVSPRSTFETVDSICFDFTPTGTDDTALLRVSFTDTDMSGFDTVDVVTDRKPGAYYSFGPTLPDFDSDSAGVVASEDFTLAHPCDSVYVFKRCCKIGCDSPCEGFKDIPVYILSTNRIETNMTCIADAIEASQKFTGDLEFTTLPRKATNPCPYTSVKLPSVTNFEINIPNIISVKF